MREEKSVGLAEVYDVASCVNRAAFVHPRLRSWASKDVALPIGCNRYLMRPSVLFRLIELLQVEAGQQALVLSMGSGYSAALLAEKGLRVYGTEEHGLITRESRKLLDALGYPTVLIRYKRLEQGWPEYAPFQRILVSCVVEDIPSSVLEQLAPDGILTAAVGSDSQQQIVRLHKKENGTIEKEYFEYCSALAGFR